MTGIKSMRADVPITYTVKHVRQATVLAVGDYLAAKDETGVTHFLSARGVPRTWDSSVEEGDTGRVEYRADNAHRWGLWFFVKDGE